ncbi:hypothetical protein G7046_g2942 [Stylonectria norvegica]|nr:hypothetical protein G7046_g2942 [Stylonectria norvegica]
MTTINSVAVLGAAGALGQVLIPALLTAGFKVTCITRPGSTPNMPVCVATKIADYTDATALTAALRGHDALVEAFNPAAAINQELIVQAAIAAGVKHLITPDFSGDTFNENAHEIRILDVKKTAQQKLESLVVATGSKLSWTAIITGLWYDWTIERGIYWVNRETRVITRYGSGDQRHSISNVALNGKALVEVLKNPQEYQNRPAYFSSHNVTTNQLIAIVHELGLEDWTVVDVSIRAYKNEAIRLWDHDTQNGVTKRLGSKAYTMLATVAMLDEDNRYGNDFGDRAEPGWDEGEAALRENLKKLIT